MKKAIIILCLVIVISSLCACGKKTKTREEHNRELIAEALDMDEDDESLKYTLSALKTIHAGRIQSAEFKMIRKDEVLDIVAEDGTEYYLYLMDVSVWAVKNLDTGEWPIKSYA